MCLREHVLNTLTGFNIPVRHIARLHIGNHTVVETLSLTHALHDLEGTLILDTHTDQICHNIITGTDCRRQCTIALRNEIFRIILPYIRSMRQTGNTHQIREALRLRLLKHVHYEMGA